MTKIGTRRPHVQTGRQQFVTAAVLVLTVAVLGAPVGAADAAAASSPYRMTMQSWDGVRLGMLLTDVAQAHGWSADSCSGDGGEPQFINGSATYGAEIAVGNDPGRVGFIEIWKPSVKGPHGLRTGVRRSAIKALLRKGKKHHAGVDSSEWWNYWIIPAKTSGFLYVRFGDGYDYGRTSHNRVATFGLAQTRAEARDRGTTQGGCF